MIVTYRSHKFLTEQSNTYVGFEVHCACGWKCKWRVAGERIAHHVWTLHRNGDFDDDD